MRYRLRTLLVVLALGPPMLAIGYHKYKEFEANEEALSRPIMFTDLDGVDWVAWYPPGTPQSVALCKQSAERPIREK
jgi:hypothetical protein